MAKQEITSSYTGLKLLYAEDSVCEDNLFSRVTSLFQNMEKKIFYAKIDLIDMKDPQEFILDEKGRVRLYPKDMESRLEIKRNNPANPIVPFKSSDSLSRAVGGYVFMNGLYLNNSSFNTGKSTPSNRYFNSDFVGDNPNREELNLELNFDYDLFRRYSSLRNYKNIFECMLANKDIWVLGLLEDEKSLVVMRYGDVYRI